MIKKVFCFLLVCFVFISLRVDAGEIVPSVKLETYPCWQFPDIRPRYYYDVPSMILPTPVLPNYIIPNPNFIPKRYYYIPAPVLPRYPCYVDVPVLVERGFFCKKYNWSYQRYYYY